MSLLSLEHRNDPTVQMLYIIMKETLDHEVHNEETTVSPLLNVYNNNRSRFKRILKALEKYGDVKRARLYAYNGLIYTQTSSSTMPESLTLPQEVVRKSIRSHQNPLEKLNRKKE